MATPPPPDHPAAGDDHSRSPRRRRPSPSPVHRCRRPGRCDQSAASARIVREVSMQFSLLETNYADWSAMMKVMLRARGLPSRKGRRMRWKTRWPWRHSSVACHWRWRPPSRPSQPPRQPRISWNHRVSILTVHACCRLNASGGSMKILCSMTASRLTTLLYDLPRWCTSWRYSVIQRSRARWSPSICASCPSGLSPSLSQLASIEFMLYTANMSIEEITGHLRAVEGRADEEADPPTAVGGKLLLTEEQWLARMKDKQLGEGSSKSGTGKAAARNSRAIRRRRALAQAAAKTIATHVTTAARKGIGQRIAVRRGRSRRISLARMMRSRC
jgi:hypothetical protein